MSQLLADGHVNALNLRPSLRPWDTSLLVLVIASGAVAAVVVSPVLWLITPFVALAVYLGARRTVAPALQAHAVASPFPSELQLAIARAMGQLPAGAALHRLNAVLRHARALFAGRESAFDDAYENETRVHVVELVIGACEVAVELARLDQVAAPQRAENDALGQRYEHARAELTKRLDAAAAALGDLYASGIEQGTPASDRVAELAAELHADASARRLAIGEMNELLNES